MKVLPKEVHYRIVQQISQVWGVDEATSLSEIMLDFMFQWSRTNIIVNTPVIISGEQKATLDGCIQRLNAGEPIQYIIGQAEFYGRIFLVSNDTLIPRQETELLIRIVSKLNSWNRPCIADIGTGSGCIAISLALEISGSVVTGFDISQEALTIAKMNANQLDAIVAFEHLDILTGELDPEHFDLIVSNPPYVMESEKSEMKSHVLHHEPSLALFVEDKDPLLFYRVISQKATLALKKEGVLFFEINEKFGNETYSLMQSMGYIETTIYQDLHGKDRFVSGKWVG